jgi:hypothetical protein
MNKHIDCGNNISVYENNEGTYTVSEFQVWLPGIYDSKETAISAVSISCNKLSEIWEDKKAKGIYLITKEDLSNNV